MNGNGNPLQTKFYIVSTVYNYIFRFLTMGISFFSVPITYSYLGKERYGIWETILSIISWAIVMDLGLGNGLRNKISIAKAKNDDSSLKTYISSAYVIISIISFVIFGIVFTIFANLKLDNLFTGISIQRSEVLISIYITILGFCLNFIFGLNKSISYGIHKSHYVTINNALSALMSILLIYVSNIFFGSSLINMALIYSFSNFIFNILFSLFIFRNNNLRPNLKRFDYAHGKKMAKLGGGFFVLQLCTIAFFSIDNVLIAKFVGVDAVASYAIANKIFFLIISLFSILVIQLWNSVTHAFEKRQIEWISRALFKILSVLILVSIVLIIIVVKFDYILQIWIGQKINIDKITLILLLTYTILHCWNSVFVNIENGIGRIRVQIIAYLIAAFLNIPLAFFLTQFNKLGVTGIILSKTICILIPAIACAVHVFLFLKKERVKEKELKRKSLSLAAECQENGDN